MEDLKRLIGPAALTCAALIVYFAATTGDATGREDRLKSCLAAQGEYDPGPTSTVEAATRYAAAKARCGA